MITPLTLAPSCGHHRRRLEREINGSLEEQRVAREAREKEYRVEVMHLRASRSVAPWLQILHL